MLRVKNNKLASMVSPDHILKKTHNTCFKPKNMLFSAHCSTLVPYWQKGKVLLTKIKKKKERRSCCAGKSEIKMGVEVRIGSKLVGGEGERGSKCWSVDSGGGWGRGGTDIKVYQTIIMYQRNLYQTIMYQIKKMYFSRNGEEQYQVNQTEKGWRLYHTLPIATPRQ